MINHLAGDSMIPREPKNKLKVPKRYKQKIGMLIKNHKLNSTDFSWSFLESDNTPDSLIEKLTYQPSEYYFIFDVWGTEIEGSYSPAKAKIFENYQSADMEDVLNHVFLWLAAISNEISSKDPWDELTKYQIPENVELSKEVLNTSFNTRERDQLVNGIRDVQKYLNQHIKQTSEQSEYVRERLDYLVESLDNLGRRNWYDICVSVLMHISMNLVLTPQNILAVWNILRESLQGIIHLIP